MNIRKIREAIIEKTILASGITSIVIVLLIFLFLLKEGLSTFLSVNPLNFLFGQYWYPISEPAAVRCTPAHRRLVPGDAGCGGDFRSSRHCQRIVHRGDRSVQDQRVPEGGD